MHVALKLIGWDSHEQVQLLAIVFDFKLEELVYFVEKTRESILQAFLSQKVSCPDSLPFLAFGLIVVAKAHYWDWRSNQQISGKRETKQQDELGRIPEDPDGF